VSTGRKNRRSLHYAFQFFFKLALEEGTAEAVPNRGGLAELSKARLSSVDPLEVVTQAELHAARQILHCAISTEVSCRKLGPEVQRIVVETHTVGDVKHFP
jgi:hypothetical protein